MGPAPVTPAARPHDIWKHFQDKGPPPASPLDPLYENCPFSHVKAAEREVMEELQAQQQATSWSRGRPEQVAGATAWQRSFTDRRQPT